MPKTTVEPKTPVESDLENSLRLGDQVRVWGHHLTLHLPGRCGGVQEEVQGGDGGAEKDSPGEGAASPP